MKNTVKLRQLSHIGNDRAEITFKLTFPVHSAGSRLFLEFLEYKKEYFKGNMAFSVTTEIPDDTCLDNDLFAIRLNWVREIAQECHHYIKSNI